MTARAKAALHAVGIIGAMLLASVFVDTINESYWEEEPFPGGETARERARGEPYWADRVQGPVRAYSFPLHLVTFVGMYGAFASLVEVEQGARFFLAAALLYPVGCLGITFFLYGVLCCAPVGLLGPFILIAWLGRAVSRKGLAFALLALLNNAAATVLAWYHFGDWFSVFGD